MSDNEMDYDLVDRNLQFIFLHHKKKGDTGTANIIEQSGQSITNLRARVAELEAERDGWTRAYDSAARDRDYQKQRVAELEADHRTLQQDGRHPAPCARHCEAAAFGAEIRQRDARIAHLEAERDRLECLCDTQYAAGVKAGWNFHAANDHAAMEKCIEDRRRDALPRLKALRIGLNNEGD